MRLAGLAFVFFSLLCVSSRGEADVLRTMLAAADDQAGGSPPPQQSADLTSWAGEARATTLPELLQISVRQSPALQSAKLDIAIAEARIQQTWARNDWLINAKLDGTKFFNANSTQFAGSADVSRALPTGGTVGLHAQSSLQEDVLGKAWTDTIGLVVSQPLLRARGRAVFEANEVKATLARDSAVLAKRLAV